MILVVGTGRLAGAVRDELAGHRRPVRSAVGTGPPGADGSPGAGAGAGAGARAAEPLEPLHLDLRRPALLPPALAGVETIVSVGDGPELRGAGPPGPPLGRGDRVLIDAAEQAGVARYVLVSSSGAHPASHLAHLRSDAAAQAHLRFSVLGHTVLRTAPLMDDWGAVLMAAAARRQVVLMAGPGRSPLRLVAARDLARIVVQAVEAPAPAPVVDVRGPELLTPAGMVEQLSHWAGRPVRVVTVPPVLGRRRPGRSPLGRGLAESRWLSDVASSRVVPTPATDRRDGATSFSDWWQEQAGATGRRRAGRPSSIPTVGAGRRGRPSSPPPRRAGGPSGGPAAAPSAPGAVDPELGRHPVG